MAMMHPDDSHFAESEPLSLTLLPHLFETRLGLKPRDIHSPKAHQGLYHKIYFVSLSDGAGRWAGRDVVLRVARRTYDRIKVGNEVAMIETARRAGVPVPEIVFYSNNAAAPDNLIGYEYICMERIMFRSLAEVWATMDPSALTTTLEQMVDIFIKLFRALLPSDDRTGTPSLGGLTLVHGELRPGPVLEETMWDFPDIKRYFHGPPFDLREETFSTLNPAGYYTNWPAYISAFLTSYIHVIQVHPNVTFLRHLLEPLQRLVDMLEVPEEHTKPWVTRLRQNEDLRGRLWHRDLHLGNFLVDEQGSIRSILDWEFAGIGPSCEKGSDPMRGILYSLQTVDPCPGVKLRDELVANWPKQFMALLRERAPDVADAWDRESDRERVLGQEGLALSTVREYLRSCLEVGVRGWGNVEKGKGDWLREVESALGTLGCMA